MRKHNKGFTLLELLIVILIISSFTLLSLNNFEEINLEHYEFINEYIDIQSKALVNKERMYMDDISFNENGHINRAKTIMINDYTMIAHIGNGYLTYEK